jgi:excisionase family DNA binding protein
MREVAADLLLTTGEAAALLGSSRQHVVDLCTSGRLPYQVVGSHRRLRRSDLVQLMGGVKALTRDQQRSAFVAALVATGLIDPETLSRRIETLPINDAKRRVLLDTVVGLRRSAE